MRWTFAILFSFFMLTELLWATQPPEFHIAAPCGVWHRSTKRFDILLTIQPNRWKIEATSKDGQPQTAVIEADYSITKDSILFGVVTAVEAKSDDDLVTLKDGQGFIDEPFRCRFRVDGNVLTIKDFKGLDGDGVLVEGRFHSKEPVGRPHRCCAVVPTDEKQHRFYQQVRSELNMEWARFGEQFPALMKNWNFRQGGVKKSTEDNTKENASPGMPNRPPIANGQCPKCEAPTRKKQGVVPRGKETAKEVSCYEHDYRNTPILPPIEKGHRPKCQEPTLVDILKALPRLQRNVPHVYEEHRDDFSYTVEKVADHIDPPRFYPLIGPAQLHQCHWKCTVHFTERIHSLYPFPFTCNRRRSEVIYLDRDCLHIVKCEPALLKSLCHDLGSDVK